MSETEATSLQVTADHNTLAMLNASETDCQIATAKKFPRSITNFRKECMAMVTLNERIAESCIYALPRGNKVIEGASARFAEVVASAWGNNKAGARVISDQGNFVTAQGVFYDLERNVCITYEVQRRITDKNGRRFNDDMIGVTANAACSIALRNAILKGVPKAFWDDMYERAKEVVRGDFATLSNRRADIFQRCQGFGVTKDQVFALMGINGEADLTLDHIVHLRGLLNAIKEGDTTVEQAFIAPEATATTEIKQPKAKTKAEPKPEPKPEPKAEPAAQPDIDKDTGEIRDPNTVDFEHGKTDAELSKPDSVGVAELTKPSEPVASADKITDSMLRIVKSKLGAAGLTEANIQNHFGCLPADLPKAKVNDVMTYIASGGK